MKLETTLLGSVEVPEDQLITFHNGLPGFEYLKEFAMIDVDENLPYKWLQAIGNADISLLLANPFVFYPAYEWSLPKQEQEEMGIVEQSQVEVWSVVTLASDMERATINLLAPIVLNKTTRAAKQVILHDSGYQTKHPLIQLAALTSDSAEQEG